MKLIIFLRFTKKERNNSSVLLIFEFTDLFTSLATNLQAKGLSKHDKKTSNKFICDTALEYLDISPPQLSQEANRNRIFIAVRRNVPRNAPKQRRMKLPRHRNYRWKYLVRKTASLQQQVPDYIRVWRVKGHPQSSHVFFVFYFEIKNDETFSWITFLHFQLLRRWDWASPGRHVDASCPSRHNFVLSSLYFWAARGPRARPDQEGVTPHIVLHRDDVPKQPQPSCNLRRAKVYFSNYPRL